MRNRDTEPGFFSEVTDMTGEWLQRTREGVRAQVKGDDFLRPLRLIGNGLADVVRWPFGAADAELNREFYNKQGLPYSLSPINYNWLFIGGAFIAGFVGAVIKLPIQTGLGVVWEAATGVKGVVQSFSGRRARA